MKVKWAVAILAVFLGACTGDVVVQPKELTWTPELVATLEEGWPGDDPRCAVDYVVSEYTFDEFTAKSSTDEGAVAVWTEATEACD